MDEETKKCDVHGCRKKAAFYYWDGINESVTATLCATCSSAYQMALNQGEIEEVEVFELGEGPAFPPVCTACEDPGGIDNDVKSTPCGSYCEECLKEHVKECEICAGEFPELIEEDEEEDEE